MVFDPNKGKLVCQYCFNEFDPPARQQPADGAPAREYKAPTASAQYSNDAAGSERRKQRIGNQAAKDAAIHELLERAPWSTAESSSTVSYTCSNCGAELLCDASVSMMECPYCGNQTMTPGTMEGTMRPDMVIPFAIDKNRCLEGLAKHYKGKMLLPGTFAESNKLEHVQGVYVPFWLFDARAKGYGSYHCEDDTRHYSGDDEVIETRHYECERKCTAAFDRVPVDSSSKMPNGHMDAIEPYDYSKLVPFNISYLPGYSAEVYDEDADVCWERPRERIEHSVSSALKSSLHYDRVSTRAEEIDVDRADAIYALMPVWLLHTTWEGEDYLFAMNGQTGKFIGDLPVAKGKAAGWFGGIALPLLILSIFLFVMPEMRSDDPRIGMVVFLCLLPFIIAGIVLWIFYSQMKTANEASEANDYMHDVEFPVKRDRYTHTTRRVIHHESNND